MQISRYAVIGLTTLGLSGCMTSKNVTEEELQAAKAEISQVTSKFNSADDSLNCLGEYIKANQLYNVALQKADSQMVADSIDFSNDSIINYNAAEKIWSDGYNQSQKISDSTLREKFLTQVFTKSEDYKYNAYKKRKYLKENAEKASESLVNKAIIAMDSIKRCANTRYCKNIFTSAKHL